MRNATCADTQTSIEWSVHSYTGSAAYIRNVDKDNCLDCSAYQLKGEAYGDMLCEQLLATSSNIKEVVLMRMRGIVRICPV